MSFMWTCPEPECGAANEVSAAKCKFCGEPKPGSKASRDAAKDHGPSVNTCERCGAVSKSVTAFMPDDPEADPSDRGVRLCPSCKLPALKRRAERSTRGSVCTVEGCTLTVEQHMAECRELMAKIESRVVKL